MLPMAGGAALSGGAGGVDLSAGPATSGSDGYNESGGATFYFSGPPSVQNTQSITKTLGLVLVVALVVWLASQK